MTQTIAKKISIYDQDLNLWLETTIAQLKTGNLQDVDINDLCYAISTGDSVFINCGRLALGEGFTLLSIDTDYFYFLGPTCKDKKSPLYVGSDSPLLPTFIGDGALIANAAVLLITGINDIGHGLHKYLYVIDRNTGVGDAITSYYILREFAVKGDLTLFREYKSDPTKDSVPTRIKYYKLLKKMK